MAPDEVILEARNIVKRYGTVEALKGVSFTLLRQNDILGLAGDNGAGKSTLIKILRGVVPPTSGELYLEGNLLSDWNPMKANEAGVLCVYQDYALCDNLSALENFFLGREITKRFLGCLNVVDFQKEKFAAEGFLKQFGFSINIHKKVGLLSGGQRRILTILRALYANPKILLLDEPTAGLSIKAKYTIFEFLKTLKPLVPMIIVLHSPEDVLAVCDRILILRLGEVSFYGQAAELDVQSMIKYY